VVEGGEDLGGEDRVKQRIRASLLLVLAATAAGSGSSHALDPRALPLGDGKVSGEPRRGYVYSCATQFRGGGAQHAGGWIHGATWDSTAKVQVQGDVAWPDARLTIAAESGERRVAGNGLPLNHTTGIFPVQRSDPAFQIDRNPNRIEAQQVAFSLPLSPGLAAAPGCVPMGPIGVALDGVAIFNALDDAGRDAVAHEVQDRCNGHPEHRGRYHYHGPSSCIPGATARNALVGYALDGFGIYSLYDESGRELTNADLDECHGRVGLISWNGREVSLYHYVLTREYPYTVGCFRGAAVRTAARADAGSAQGGPPRPPAEAIAACSGLAPDASCRFTSPRGDAIGGTCRARAGFVACVPERR
jgi:hypothetical protein